MTTDYADGSSPHAWGTRKVVPWAQPPTRFIPTCVGNTFPCGGSAGGAPVHPHMRGEHVNVVLWLKLCLGSSPHAWGTHKDGRRIARVHRFIPTCVGNTQSWPLAPSPSSVHPHMRGEHPRRRRTSACKTGSSPHAWGTHAVLQATKCQRRFIPTCVGNTRALGLMP